MNDPQWHPRPALASELELQVPEGYGDHVVVLQRQADRFAVEVVITAAPPRSSATPPDPGTLRPADLTVYSRPLPWLGLGRNIALLRARVWCGQALEVGRAPDGRETRRALPPVGPVWVWDGGRIILEGLEQATSRDVRDGLPGLALLRRVVSDARPGPPEKYGRELAEAIRREHAEMSARLGRRVSWAEVGARHGLDRRRVSEMRKKYPPG